MSKDKPSVHSGDLLDCPICGNQPTLMTRGTFIDIECCVSMSRQKSDYMTMEERQTWCNNRLTYSDEAEAKVLALVTGEWNTRKSNTSDEGRTASGRPSPADC
jgi:hypothetical protein